MEKTTPAPLLSMEQARTEFFPYEGRPSRGTFYAWGREGRLPLIRIGKRCFISRKGMERLIEGGNQAVSN